MKKDLEKRNEFIGLEEINQVETNEVNGGCSCIQYPPTTCYWNIPPSPTDIIRQPHPFPFPFPC